MNARPFERLFHDRRRTSPGRAGRPACLPWLDPLEPRRLFSGSHVAAATAAGHIPATSHAAAPVTAAATRPATATPARKVRLNTDWPVAPFTQGAVTNVYVNPFGIATLPNQTLKSFSGYDVWFDDGGPITVTTTGRVATDVAYYPLAGYPAAANNQGNARYTNVTGTVSDQKLLESIGVRPQTAGATGSFTLHVAGPPEGKEDPIDFSHGVGEGGTDISGTYDIDYYKFKLPSSGNWRFRVQPTTSTLDMSLNVYDAAGNPIGGTFTSAINKYGPGQPETWYGYNLRGGAVYYIRVDGANDQRGNYEVSVRPA